MTSTSDKPRIVIVGGGVSGLSAAHRLVEWSRDNGRPIDLSLVEGSDRLGGVIHTIRRDDGFLLEAGPDNFITNKPAGIRLVERLGLTDELIEPNEQHRRAMVVRKGRLCAIPDGFQLMASPSVWSVLRSPIFSWGGKLRMAMEPFVKAKRDMDAAYDESLASFVTRRFGKEALDRLIQPMIGGIYTADPQTLSLRATLPRFLDMEREYGSVVRGLRKRRSGTGGDTGARYSLFVSFRGGMSTMIDALSRVIGQESIRMNTRVTGLQRASESDAPCDQRPWRVEIDGRESIEADHVVLACGARRSADLLQQVDTELADVVGSVAHASSAVVHLAFRRKQVGHRLDAFGFVVPHVEGMNILAGSFSSVKYAGRAPDEHVLLRAFVGGALQPDLMQLDDAAITRVVQTDLASLLSIQGGPKFTTVHRWFDAMPQYEVGHLQRVETIEASLANHTGLALAGNALGGVGIPDCIAQAERVVDDLTANLPALAGG